MTITISSHTLNGVDGTHAGGIAVTLIRLSADHTRDIVFQTETDLSGRVIQEVSSDQITFETKFELIFETGAYWSTQDLSRNEPQIMSEIVVRFIMPNSLTRHHIPIIISPNSYSVWWSS